MREPLRAGDRVTVERDSEIARGVVRAQDFGKGYLFVDLVDKHRSAEFSSTRASPELQQFDSVVVFLRDENKTWVRGWMEPDEAKAIFVAEALA